MSSELRKLVEKRDLTSDEAFYIASSIMKGELPDALVAGILIALRMKGETPDEIASFVRSMRSFMIKAEGSPNSIDTAGTGGDGMNTVNVSTASAIAVSSVVPVFKHGNRAVSSSSGSADVLEAFGYDINVKPEEVSPLVRKTNFVFLFAQLYHPAMRNVAPIRKTLGVRTLFNVLGPFTNPASVKRQVIGVFSKDYMNVLIETAKILNYEKIILVHGEPGIDEVSVSGKTFVKILDHGKVLSEEFVPEDFGASIIDLNKLRTSSAEESAIRILRSSLGKDREVSSFIRANIAMDLLLIEKVKNLRDGYEMADSLLSELPSRAKQIISSHGNERKLQELLDKARG
ncbi:anthranilate phosphoribosyltransferase [Sulfuracidifex metallicus]|uniref:Anthranilate phosphoribosyltransferase n=1 Tax=Sulfuracidifex metallicus DSM 6482 = JCM 9184 TaxID=523847 RepID=A0A6A9QFE3_SULME|nr:anthranilate phosphoribosyltransferase [Sulfuracidifex metallicus]MUN27947.1 anthranilate phosphoribosyltransferase [Sulfuracidifex metallicus DSM 6482 = JCM 9184]WOE51501.1 anthranilate phosphoribosyltransferase [Sulfuracidifex metallicus DSM 6482 = JCM 9184]